MHLHEFEGRDISYYATPNEGIHADVGGSDLLTTAITAAQPIIEAAVPVATRIGKAIIGVPEEAPKPAEKALPSKEKLHDILREKHLLISEIVPPTENGTAQAKFNNGNPHETKFDFDNPLCRVDYALIWHHGQANIATIADFARVTEDELTAIKMKHIYEFGTDPKTGEATITAPYLAEYLRRMRENDQFPYQALLLSPDLEAFTSLDSYKAYEQQRMAQKQPEKAPLPFEVVEYSAAAD
jgi:hypothetical protein